MSKYTWFKKDVAEYLEVRQVYGIAFSNNGQVLLRLDNNTYKLTGGHPEENDRCFEETLKREFIEELNTEIEDVIYLGYLMVEENADKYAQVRMIARVKIDGIGKNIPDLDNGKSYQRYFANQNNVKKYLNYSDLAGNQMIDDAINLANQRYDFDYKDNTNEYFI